jgi:hypothetical protein
MLPAVKKTPRHLTDISFSRIFRPELPTKVSRMCCTGGSEFPVLLCFKGTVAWDFRAFFWLVDRSRPEYKPLLVLRFKEAPSIWDGYFKFWCVSCQTFSEILRISEKDWQLNLRSSEIYLNCQLLWDMLMLCKNVLGEPRTELPILLPEWGTRLPILLGDSKNLRETFTP